MTATALQAAALWLWHAPQLFDRALASDRWHAAQHASFLVTALLFWRAMLRRRADPAADRGARVVASLCLFLTSIVSGALGAPMAFSHSPWYAGHARFGTAPFGLTAAEDQQLAGLIMWIPGGLVHCARGARPDAHAAAASHPTRSGRRCRLACASCWLCSASRP